MPGGDRVTAPIDSPRAAPYTIRYKDDKTGEMKTIRRQPPVKLHQTLPKDKVELLSKRSDSFDEGGTYTVKGISPRSPNILQLENGDGETTFIEYHDTKLVSENAEPETSGDNVSPAQASRIIKSKYMIWP
jgi:hypothetical protein